MTVKELAQSSRGIKRGERTSRRVASCISGAHPRPLG